MYSIGDTGLRYLGRGGEHPFRNSKIQRDCMSGMSLLIGCPVSVIQFFTEDTNTLSLGVRHSVSRRNNLNSWGGVFSEKIDKNASVAGLSGPSQEVLFLFLK